MNECFDEISTLESCRQKKCHMFVILIVAKKVFLPGMGASIKY